MLKVFPPFTCHTSRFKYKRTVQETKTEGTKILPPFFLMQDFDFSTIQFTVSRYMMIYTQGYF